MLHATPVHPPTDHAFPHGFPRHFQTLIRTGLSHSSAFFEPCITMRACTHLVLQDCSCILATTFRKKQLGAQNMDDGHPHWPCHFLALVMVSAASCPGTFAVHNPWGAPSLAWPRLSPRVSAPSFIPGYLFSHARSPIMDRLPSYPSQCNVLCPPQNRRQSDPSHTCHRPTTFCSTGKSFCCRVS